MIRNVKTLAWVGVMAAGMFVGGAVSTPAALPAAHADDPSDGGDTVTGPAGLHLLPGIVCAPGTGGGGCIPIARPEPAESQDDEGQLDQSPVEESQPVSAAQPEESEPAAAPEAAAPEPEPAPGAVLPQIPLMAAEIPVVPAAG